MEQLSPHQVKQLLIYVLDDIDSRCVYSHVQIQLCLCLCKHLSPPPPSPSLSLSLAPPSGYTRSALSTRQLHGALNRVPPLFYEKGEPRTQKPLLLLLLIFLFFSSLQYSEEGRWDKRERQDTFTGGREKQYLLAQNVFPLKNNNDCICTLVVCVDKPLVMYLV